MPKKTKKAHSAVGAAEQAAGNSFAGHVSQNDSNTFSSGERHFSIEAGMKIYDFLPTGAERAVPKTSLMEITGLGDRELRNQVQRERLAGCQILTDCAGGGYYRPETPDEVQRFVRSMRHRGSETLAVADAVEQAMLREFGQESLEGF